MAQVLTCQLCERRAEEIDRAMAHVATLEQRLQVCHDARYSVIVTANRLARQLAAKRLLSNQQARKIAALELEIARMRFANPEGEVQ